MDASLALLMAEVLKLQQWAGIQHSPELDRIYGLANGFESAIERERESYGISREEEEAVEDWLEEMEDHVGELTGMGIKDQLRKRGIKETVARRVMELCLLQSRFPDVIERVIRAPGSTFKALGHRPDPLNWFGALHYIEVVGSNIKYPIFCATVPRIGETIEPEPGMKCAVVDVIYQAATEGETKDTRRVVLVPHVVVKPK